MEQVCSAGTRTKGLFVHRMKREQNGRDEWENKI
jgi:hypothetical protein